MNVETIITAVASAIIGIIGATAAWILKVGPWIEKRRKINQKKKSSDDRTALADYKDLVNHQDDRIEELENRVDKAENAERQCQQEMSQMKLAYEHDLAEVRSDMKLLRADVSILRQRGSDIMATGIPALLIFNEAGEILTVSTKFAVDLYWSQKELTGKNISEVVPERYGSVLDMPEHNRVTQFREGIPMHLTRQDRSETSVMVNLAFLLHGGQKYCVMLTRKNQKDYMYSNEKKTVQE